MIFKIAFRNVLRQKRRTFFTALTITVAFALSSFSIGWADGSYNNIIKLFTEGWLGHIQVHFRDYLEKPSLYKTIKNYTKIGEKIKSIKAIKTWTPRIYSAGLLSFNDKTTGVNIIGIEPQKEDETTNFHKKIISGSYFKKGAKNEVLIGKLLSKILNAKVGDKLVLVSQAADGSIANDIFILRGIVSTGDDNTDRVSLYMSLNDAQEFLSLGKEIHEITIIVNSIKDVKKVSEKISKTLKNKNLSVSPWQEFAKDFWKAMKADKKGMWISLFVIMLIVAVGVLNTVLMSVLERTREYGLLKALGTKPKDIILIVLYETNIIVFLSIIAGSILGLIANYYFSINGIQLSEPFTYGGMKFSKMVTEINLRSFTIPSITIFITANIVSIFPAIKAARTEPVKSMRFH